MFSASEVLLYQFCGMIIMLLCVQYRVPGLVLLNVPRNQQESSAVLQQLFCGSGAPVRVFHVAENTGFKAAGVRVPKWRERRYYAGRTKANIHASSAVSSSPSSCRSSDLCIMCY